MHCSKCGKEISEDSKICIYYDEKTSKVMDIVKGRKQLIIVVAVLMSILIAIFIAIISASQKNTVNVEDAAAAIKEEYAVLIGYGTENVNPLITTLYTGFEVQVVEIEKTQDRYM